VDLNLARGLSDFQGTVIVAEKLFWKKQLKGPWKVDF